MNAIEKLTKERSESKSNYEKMVADALIKRCRESNALSADVMKQGKTLENCFMYIREQARKEAKNGCAVIEDSRVYEWAEDYYHAKDEPKKEAPKSAPKTAEIVKFDKGKAIAKATAKKPEKPTPKSLPSKPIVATVAKKATTPKPTPKPTPKTPEFKADGNGQMTLFGLPF